MIYVGVSTCALSGPLLDIKASFTSQECLTDIFRPAWHKVKGLTFALGAIALDSTILEDCALMLAEQVPTEASRLRSNSKTLVTVWIPTTVHFIALPSDIDTTFH